MRNNKTTATLPLRASEASWILEQQISGLIKREGAGQFENVIKKPAVKRTRKKPA